MFKFFEGALGDILAPVSGPSNALFLAIQHHKDDEVRKILSSHETDVSRLAIVGTLRYIVPAVTTIFSLLT
jgi:hypothetical protein